MTPIFGFLDSPFQIAILLGLGVLLFGRKLPEVGRSLGKGLAEFRKGLKGIEDDIDGSTTRTEPPPPMEQPRPPQRVATTAPKFEDAGPAPAAPAAPKE
jgi:sec-independent protein translocase protein TatA